MSPKKAIKIVLVLFLAVLIIFGFLYFKQKMASPGDESMGAGTGASSTGLTGEIKKEPLKPSEVIEEKVNKIIEEAEKNPSASTPAEVRQDVISTINQEIIKQEQNKTPEQKAADLKAAEERQKVIDEINNQIKQGKKSSKGENCQASSDCQSGLECYPYGNGKCTEECQPGYQRIDENTCVAGT